MDMWKQLIGNIILVLGCLGASVALLDWFLTAKQKKGLEDRVYAAWLWFDERKRLSPLYYLRQRKIHYSMCIAPFLIVALVGLLNRKLLVSGADVFYLIVFVLMMSGFTLMIHSSYVPGLIESTTLRQYVARTFKMISRAPLRLVLWGAVIAYAGLSLDVGVVQWFGKALAKQGFASATVLVWILVLSFIVVLFVQVLRACFACLELLLRRALEQGKGLLASVSALLSAVGVLLKSFS